MRKLLFNYSLYSHPKIGNFKMLHWPYRTTPYSGGDGLTRRNNAGIWFPSGVRGRRGGDLPLTRALAACQSIQCSGWGSGHGVTSLWRWTHASLERGGVSPEGASGPRARRNFGVTVIAWFVARGRTATHPSCSSRTPCSYHLQTLQQES
jgi:hypothetical protein